MKEKETKDKFLELRARGRSLRTIEKEIGVGRHTLAKWESECKEELENLKAIENEALREEYRLTAQARAERFGGQLDRVMRELKNRDLSTVPPAKLVDIAIKLDTQLQDAIPGASIPSAEVLTARRAFRKFASSLEAARGPGQRLKLDQASGGNGQIKADDLVALQVAILQRYAAGDIDGHSAATQMDLLNSVSKGIETADLQNRLEHIEALLADGRSAL